jgi:beta-lactamase superfamily II metal-dependent hydrolase
MIKIKIIPAEDGDCFLITLKENEKSTESTAPETEANVNRNNKDELPQEFNILVDSGRNSTYKQYLKRELLSLKEEDRQLNLFIITHIDDDHIEGALPFLAENGPEMNIIKIEEVWHNTYRHMQFEKEKIASISDQEKNILKELIDRKPTVTDEDGYSEISVKSGVSLGSHILNCQYNWNKRFKEKAVCIENEPETYNFPFTFKLLSPRKIELDKLSKKWHKKLGDILYDFNISNELIFDDAFEFSIRNKDLEESEDETENISSTNPLLEQLSIIEKKDSSLENGSSIAFYLEYLGKKILFLGDAYSEVIYESLIKLKTEGIDPIFDVVKIAHHGSIRNNSKSLIDLIETKKYIFSTNGLRNSHPSMETIAKILLKQTPYPKELIFNYRLDNFQFLEEKEIQDKYNFTVSFNNDLEIF